MIRRLILTAVSAVAFVPAASAGLLPGVVSSAADGKHTRFSYAVVLPSDSQLVAGNRFTIYDFNGYVPGTEQGPADWAFQLANVGPTPEFTAPDDDPAKPNLSWTYSGPAADGPRLLGDFGANSIYSDRIPSWFTATTLTVRGRVDQNITTTWVPVHTAGPVVPEPGTLLLAGLGLPLVGLVGRLRGRA